MSPELLLALAALFAIGAYVQAYSWGWQSGHDIHHEEPNNGPRNDPEPPKSLWV